MPMHDLMTWGVVAIFILVYAGMILGGLPRLKLDRSGVALLGAIGVIGLGDMSIEQAARSVDLPTVLLLFSFMVVSAQMRLGGFYAAVTRQVAALPLGRNALLGAIIAVAGALSAVYSNDIICLAMTPVVAQLCLQRRLNPVPFLLGLACAANIGSAATLIGSVLHLPFGGCMRQALPPVVLSLVLLWAWLVWGPGARAHAEADHRGGLKPLADSKESERGEAYGALQSPPFDAWQTTKGLLVAGVLLLIFLFTDWPREVAALALFVGLFVVNHAFESTGLAAQAVALLAAQGVHLANPGPLFAAGVGLSNLVSNVPAVMLLLPHLKSAQAGVTLALVNTFAGNLLLVGSIANLIVVDLAQKSGIRID